MILATIQPMHRFLRFILPAVTVLAVSSCQTFHFYGQAVCGQFEILTKSRANPSVMADPASSPLLRKQLGTVEEIRCFASDRLLLPGE